MLTRQRIPPAQPATQQTDDDASLPQWRVHARTDCSHDCPPLFGGTPVDLGKRERSPNVPPPVNTRGGTNPVTHQRHTPHARRPGKPRAPMRWVQSRSPGAWTDRHPHTPLR
jgi:hypothetical protein